MITKCNQFVDLVEGRLTDGSLPGKLAIQKHRVSADALLDLEVRGEMVSVGIVNPWQDRGRLSGAHALPERGDIDVSMQPFSRGGRDD